MKIIFPASIDKEKGHALRQFQTNKITIPTLWRIQIKMNFQCEKNGWRRLAIPFLFSPKLEKETEWTGLTFGPQL